MKIETVKPDHDKITPQSPFSQNRVNGPIIGRQTLNERVDIECYPGCRNSGSCEFPSCKSPGNAR